MLKFAQISNIAKVEIVRKLGKSHSGIEITTDKNEKYKFGQFGDRDTAFARIQALWEASRQMDANALKSVESLNSSLTGRNLHSVDS